MAQLKCGSYFLTGPKGLAAEDARGARRFIAHVKNREQITGVIESTKKADYAKIETMLLHVLGRMQTSSNETENVATLMSLSEASNLCFLRHFETARYLYLGKAERGEETKSLDEMQFKEKVLYALGELRSNIVNEICAKVSGTSSDASQSVHAENYFIEQVGLEIAHPRSQVASPVDVYAASGKKGRH